MSVMDVLLVKVITVSRISEKSSFCLVATVLGSKGGQALGIVFAFSLAMCFARAAIAGRAEFSVDRLGIALTSASMRYAYNIVTDGNFNIEVCVLEIWW